MLQKTDKVKSIFHDALKDHNKYITAHISCIDPDHSDDELHWYQKEWEKQKYAYNGAFKLYLQSIVNEEFAQSFDFGKEVKEYSEHIVDEMCKTLNDAKDASSVSIHSIVDDIDTRLLWTTPILDNIRPEFLDTTQKEFGLVRQCYHIRTSYVYDIVMARYKFYMHSNILYSESIIK